MAPHLAESLYYSLLSSLFVCFLGGGGAFLVNDCEVLFLPSSRREGGADMTVSTVRWLTDTVLTNQPLISLEMET